MEKLTKYAWLLGKDLKPFAYINSSLASSNRRIRLFLKDSRYSVPLGDFGSPVQLRESYYLMLGISGAVLALRRGIVAVRIVSVADLDPKIYRKIVIVAEIGLGLLITAVQVTVTGIDLMTKTVIGRTTGNQIAVAGTGVAVEIGIASNVKKRRKRKKVPPLRLLLQWLPVRKPNLTFLSHVRFIH